MNMKLAPTPSFAKIRKFRSCFANYSISSLCRLYSCEISFLKYSSTNRCKLRNQISGAISSAPMLGTEPSLVFLFYAIQKCIEKHTARKILIIANLNFLDVGKETRV